MAAGAAAVLGRAQVAAERLGTTEVAWETQRAGERRDRQTDWEEVRGEGTEKDGKQGGEKRQTGEYRTGNC